MSYPSIPEETFDHKAAKVFGRSIPPDSYHHGDSLESFHEIWKKAARFGLFNLLIPQGEPDVEKLLSTLEGFGEGCESGGFLLAMGAHCCGVGAPLAEFGCDQQKNQLPSLRDGSIIAAFAATEPDAGSDVMSLTTRFWADDDNYILNGTKCFVTNIQEA